jgi:hypothetical protein
VAVENIVKISKAHMLIMAAPALLGASLAQAGPTQYQCFDFGSLVAGREYTVGETIDTEHATITIKPYFSNGNPATATVRHAESVVTNFAGGTAPELSLYLVSVNVVPKQPIAAFKMLLAQSIGQAGEFANANIEVNGEKHESPRGFAQMDGKRIGKPGKGRAEVTVNMLPASGNWHAGALDVRAKPGETLASFTLGGHTWRIDDLCFAL